MSEPARIPTLDQIRALYETLWAFFLKNSHRYSWWGAQEDEFLPLFTRLADALQPLRSLLDSVTNWPHAIERSIPLAIENFDAVAEAWGWEGIVQPEPERSAYIEARRARFRKEVERPFYEAVLSWQKGWKVLEFSPAFDQYAEAGRKLSFGPTVSPEEGKATAISKIGEINTLPILGKAYPVIDEERERGLGNSFSLLDNALKSIGLSNGWSPRHGAATIEVQATNAPPSEVQPTTTTTEALANRSTDERISAPKKARPKKRDQGKAERCLGIYMDAVGRNITPPTVSELAKQVDCSIGTASRAVASWEAKRAELSRKAAEERYRDAN